MEVDHIEPLGGTHAKTMLHSKFVKFLQSIRECGKPAPIFLLEKILKNTNTVTGKNIRHIALETGEFDLLNANTDKLKKNMKFAELEENSWKVNMIKELTNVRKQMMVIENYFDPFFNNSDIDIIIRNLAIS